MRIAINVLLVITRVSFQPDFVLSFSGLRVGLREKNACLHMPSMLFSSQIGTLLLLTASSTNAVDAGASHFLQS